MGKTGGKPAEAVDALICAVWCCDDGGNLSLAARFRSCAVELMELEKEKTGEISEERMVQRADLLRRSGRFEELLLDYSNYTCKDETNKKIVKYQLYLARAEDAGPYTLQQALLHSAQ